MLNVYSFQEPMKTILLLISSTFFISTNLLAQEVESSHLISSFDQQRSELEDKGISVESVLVNDFVANVSGGAHRTAGVLGNFDLTASFDTKKLGFWDNGTLFVYVLGNYGRNPSEYVGDLQASNNIEAYDTIKLYEFWYNHNFMDEKLSILVGLHDYNSEFDALDYAGTLINSSFGIQFDISQVGPSIFSTTALAARFKYQVTDQSYLQTAIYDGIPGSPTNQRGTHLDLRSGEGVFLAAEAGYTSKEDQNHYKYALGGWYHTAEFEDYSATARDSNSGVYLIGEDTICTETDPEQGLGVFFQYGVAKADRNQIGHYYGAGLMYTGLVPERDQDILSFGIASARNGGAYRSANLGSDKNETVFELTYRAEILPYLVVQPDLQYIVNPSTDSSLKDAFVVGIRTELSL